MKQQHVPVDWIQSEKAEILGRWYPIPMGAGGQMPPMPFGLKFSLGVLLQAMLLPCSAVAGSPRWGGSEAELPGTRAGLCGCVLWAWQSVFRLVVRPPPGPCSCPPALYPGQCGGLSAVAWPPLPCWHAEARTPFHPRCQCLSVPSPGSVLHTSVPMRTCDVKMAARKAQRVLAAGRASCPGALSAPCWGRQLPSVS